MSEKEIGSSANAILGTAVLPDRRAAIRDLVHEEGPVTVDQLVRLLGVSRMTVHRDLDALESEGVLRRVRGGATASGSSLFESDLPFRMTSAVAAKHAIGRKAAQMVEGGSAVILDESTTAFAALRAFENRVPVSVITNFLPAMQYVITSTPHRLIALGGDFVPRYQSFLGIICEQAISGVYADILLASCSAIRGLEMYHQDQQIMGTKRAMLASAPTRVLLVDSSKVNVGAIYRLGAISEFTHLITDEGISPEFADKVSDQGVQVIIAPLTNSK